MGRIFICTILALYLSLNCLLLPAESSESVLVAEIKDARSTYSFPYYGVLPDSMAFCIGSVFATADQGCPCEGTHIGCDQFFPNNTSGQPMYATYNIDGSAAAQLILSYMQDGYNGGVCIGERATSISANQYILAGGGTALGEEADMIDGINTPPDLKGTTINFIRLRVNKVSVGVVDYRLTLDWDIVWEFWGGIEPTTLSAGQRSDVDNFLMYASPINKTTDLEAGETSFKVHVFYGQL